MAVLIHIHEQGGRPGIVHTDRRSQHIRPAHEIGGDLGLHGQYGPNAGMGLVEHTGGVLTEPALLAYRRAAELDGNGVGPGYFLGLALIRQGQLGQAANLWRETLEAAAPDAPGREVLALRLQRLDTLLAQPGGLVVPK